MCWCTVAGFTVTAFGAGEPGCFVVDPELDPEEELEAPDDEADDPVLEDEPVPEDELESDELVPDEVLELVDPVPDEVPDPDVPELASYVVPELDPWSPESGPPSFAPPPHAAARATELTTGAKRPDRIRMGRSFRGTSP